VKIEKWTAHAGYDDGLMTRLVLHVAAALGISLVVTGLVNGMDFDRASGMMPSGPPYLSGGQQGLGQPVEGEVVRIDGDHYFVEDPYGNEIRLIVNESTLRTGPIKQGERVEARVDNDDHALSIRPIRTSEPDSADGRQSSREGK
jgi:hypothetical protein